MGFTFYGDLLGISGYYRLSPTLAKDKLNDFYNTVFFSLSDYCRQNTDVSVHMFSDSLLFYGDNPASALEQLHRVYIKLLNKGLLLRGGMVSDRLDFQIRTELQNFEKQLPENDTLARAVGLESTKKGARLLIETRLAESMLADLHEWLTHEGYVNVQGQHPYSGVPYESILRRIAATPEQDAYECLYFWVCHRHSQHEEVDYEVKIENLEEIKVMKADNIAQHYKETVELLKRCNKRQNFTRKKLGIW